jgi:hypothetical protein
MNKKLPHQKKYTPEAQTELRLVGRKGGRVKRERLAARLVDQELREYVYR